MSVKKWFGDLAGTLNYQYHTFAPYRIGVDGGLAVLSCHPVRLLRIFHFRGYAAMAVKAEIGNEPHLLLSVHLKRINSIRIKKRKIDLPWRKALSLLWDEVTKDTDRTQAIEELIAWIKVQPYTHVIVAGDFNTIPFSKSIRTLNRDLNDALWPSLAYFRGTYNQAPLPIRPRIDFIFHSPNLKCTDAGIIRESAGDHYPVWAEFDPQISQIRAD